MTTAQAPKTDSVRTAPDPPRRRVRDVVADYAVLGAFVALIIAFSLARPDTFPTLVNIEDIFNSCVTYVIFGSLVTMVLVLGEFDLAFPNIADFTSVVVGVLVLGHTFNTGIGVVAAIVIGLTAGLLAGIASGVFISNGRIPSFIVTLAVGSVVAGVQLAVQGHIPGGVLQIAPASVPGVFRDISVRHIFGSNLQTGLIVAVIVALVAITVLRLSVLGRRIQAVGGNSRAAFLASIPVGRVRVIVFATAGLLAAVTGIVNLGSQGYYDGASTPYLLQVYTAAFLGRAVWPHHRFSVTGTIIASLFLQTLTDGLNLLNEPTWIVSVASGVVLLLAVTMTVGGKTVTLR